MAASSHAEMDSLPDDVLEKILGFLDGLSFAKCSEVCHRWKFISENIFKVQDWWRNTCLAEIPKHILQDLCGHYPINANQEYKNIYNFRKIFARWFLCRSVSSKIAHISKHSCFVYAPITCCKLSGSWILTGHRNGSICAWSSETGAMIQIVTQHLRMITDFILLDLLKHGHYSCPFSESPCGHQYMVSISKDHNIQISSLLEATYGIYFESQILRQHSDSLESIKLFGDRFAVLCANNTVSVWQLMLKEDTRELPNVSLQYFLMGPEEGIAWITFSGQKLGCLCKTGVFKTLDLPSETWSNDHYPELQEICSDYPNKNHAIPNDYTLILSSAYMFWDSAIFLVSADNRLWVSLCGSKYILYPVWEEFQSYVLCASLRGSILALGLENGMLIVFQINKPQDLMDIQTLRPAWQKKLSSVSIISVDVYLKDDGPQILAATTNAMITICWSINTFQTKSS